MEKLEFKKGLVSVFIALGFTLSGCQVDGLDNVNINTHLDKNGTTSSHPTNLKDDTKTDKQPPQDTDDTPSKNGTGDTTKGTNDPYNNDDTFTTIEKRGKTEPKDKPNTTTPKNIKHRFDDKNKNAKPVEPKSTDNGFPTDTRNGNSNDIDPVEPKIPDFPTDFKDDTDYNNHKNRDNNDKTPPREHKKPETSTPKNKTDKKRENTKPIEPRKPENTTPTDNRDKKEHKKPESTIPTDKPDNNKRVDETDGNKKDINTQTPEDKKSDNQDSQDKKATNKSGVWRFIVTGDSRGGDNGINSRVLRAIKDDLIKMKPKPAFVIFSGDLVNKGRSSELNYFKKVFQKPLDDNGIKFYAIRGNHDGSSSQFRRAFDYFPDNGPREDRGLTYKVSYKNSVFFFIDGAFSGRGFARHQLDWLYKNFKTMKAEHGFLIAHSPLWSTGNHTPLYRGSSRELETLLDRATNVNLSTYFCGHDHFFDLSLKKTSKGKIFRQFLLGTAGAPLYEQDEDVEETSDSLYHYKGYGYSVFEVDGNSIKTWFVPLNGDKKIKYDYVEE